VVTVAEKHRDPLYLRNARIVRAQVRRAWAHGLDLRCNRCGRPIEPATRFDVGHLDPDGGHEPSNLAAEHVRCNRSEGGRRGAAIANGKAKRPAVTRRSSSEGLAPW
jgi:hypothetical protein